ncbi:MAG TPA: DUF5615 family PIN-like protein [Acidobacteriota bacterium]|nr:DUF5615 family PIN-like protein [Acidobacteriota bacterium]HKZ40654.1 DUF5615 family PIN-like protein [Candidatus Hodarchaeales archaeon]
MKVVADEDVDGRIVQHLRQSGYYVIYIAEVSPRATDSDVIRIANDEQAVLLTGDKGIAELIVLGSATLPSGLVILRIAELSSHEKIRIVDQVFKQYASELSGSIILSVMPGPMVRVRHT